MEADGRQCQPAGDADAAAADAAAAADDDDDGKVANVAADANYHDH